MFARHAARMAALRPRLLHSPPCLASQSDASSIDDWELHAGDLREVEARKAARRAERARQQLPREERVQMIAGEMARVRVQCTGCGQAC